MIKYALTLLLLFVSFTMSELYGGTYRFSVDDRSINVKNDLKLYLYFDQPIDATFATVAKLKPLLSFKEKDDKGADVPFVLFVDGDNNDTVLIRSDHVLKSKAQYFISFDGDKIKDIYGEAYFKERLQFTTSSYSKLIADKKTITLNQGQSSAISLTMNEYFKDVSYEVSINTPELVANPAIISFDNNNWNTPQQVTISSMASDRFNEGKYKVTLRDKKSGFYIVVDVQIKDKIEMVFDKLSLLMTTNSTTLKTKLSKKPPERMSINFSLPTDAGDKGITITPTTITFDENSSAKFQTIAINVNSQALKTTSFTTHIMAKADKFNGGEKKIALHFIDPAIASLPKATIKANSVYSLGAEVSWGLPSLDGGEVRYELYLAREKMSYSKATLLHSSTDNIKHLSLFPGTNYFFSVKAYFKQLPSDNNVSDQVQRKQQPIDQEITYPAIEIDTPKVTFNDHNNNGIVDDLERKILSQTGEKTLKIEDKNEDNITDALQQFVADIFAQKDFSIYDNYTDSDGDFVPDFIEVAMGRSPKSRDYLGDNTPTIDIQKQILNNQEKILFWEQDTSLVALSGVQAFDSKTNITGLLKAYYKEKCFNDEDKINAQFIFNTCKQVFLQHLPLEQPIDIYWTVFDEDNNLAFRQERIKIYKGKPTISFQTYNYIHHISSPDSKTLFMPGFYAKQAPDNNISLQITQMPNIEQENLFFNYTNPITDVKMMRLPADGMAKIIIPQVVALDPKSILRLYINKKWVSFNEDTTTDGIYTSSGINKRCDIDAKYYQQGIIDVKKVTQKAYCLKVVIADGSVNDGDGKKDGFVSFTGGMGAPVDFVQFENKSSSGCSSLHARGFDHIGQPYTAGGEFCMIDDNKIDPLLLIMWVISLAFVLKMVMRKPLHPITRR